LFILVIRLSRALGLERFALGQTAVLLVILPMLYETVRSTGSVYNGPACAVMKRTKVQMNPACVETRAANAIPSWVVV
jgi:hypothetical protein